MIFSEKSCRLLKSMKIVPDEYSNFLQDQHGEAADIFNNLVEMFSEHSIEELSTKRFNCFIKEYNVIDDSLIFNQLYDFFNCLRLFCEGGVFKLFKGWQAEWRGAQIRINESDVPTWDVSKLNEPIIVYRGMSKAEYASGSFGQSWSVNQQVAQRFARGTYSDENPGIVVKACINIESVLYYDSQDYEEEVIVKDAYEFKAEIIE